MNIIWVPRSTWGSSQSTEDFIRDRRGDPAEGKTEIHIHHTAAVDSDDATPNRWDYDEAVAYMQRLEWVRKSDLGPLPYSENYAVNEELDRVWVFEGRGWVKRGAHTGGHNIPGVGLGAFGNFNKDDPGAAAAILEAMQERVLSKRTGPLPNLGNTKSPNGWNVWGHRDSKATACPGDQLYSLLADFNLEAKIVEDDPLQTRVEALEARTAALESAQSNAAAMDRADAAHDRLDAAKAAL